MIDQRIFLIIPLFIIIRLLFLLLVISLGSLPRNLIDRVKVWTGRRLLQWNLTLLDLFLFQQQICSNLLGEGVNLLGGQVRAGADATVKIFVVTALQLGVKFYYKVVLTPQSWVMNKTETFIEFCLRTEM